MQAIEIVIRVGDRSMGDNGQVKWRAVDQRVAMVNGDDLESMQREAMRMVEPLLKQACEKK